ncbi:T9SS type B sorting domain-containing protein [Algibacter agarivorans]|uniref:T9SS type B sorting domain-containing protein n=1 Tax=Algibacter agarivorans TaxID=1109741 RepID=A0ABP9GSB4_9FLAO
MKKSTYYKLVFIVLFLLLGIKGIAQTYKTFSIRKNMDVKGSMLVVGNNILGESNAPFNNDTVDNQDISMQYIDIDNDVTTFNSSGAELLMPIQPDGNPTTCYRVVYAALYWGAVLQDGSRTDINKVKFKLPESTTYVDIDGEIIYDAFVDPIIAEDSEPGNTPYACYADVTDLLSGLSSNIEGDYTVANVISSEGSNYSTGLSAGWTLFVIYENPNLHMKSFTSFDGFSHIFDGHYEEVPVTGFTTPQSGPIDLQFAYAALDGDKTKRATKLEINGKEVTTPLRPANKFFGSVIENNNGISNPRTPSGTNTLGYDTGFLEIFGAEPEYIKNNVSSASFTLQVARGQADPIFAFFSAFAVDIIAPDIDLTKIVVNTAGDDIDGADVNLGQNLFYEITYQSVGNDNVTQFTLKDVLPDNIVFDPLTDIDLSNAGGATLQSYDPVTRTLIFNIPDSSVEVNDPEFVIRIAVQVVPNCYDLSQACSNEIKNQAFATYRGVINPAIIQDEGSFASVECLGTPGSTNFLVDISNCTFERNEVLCGASVILTASDGYDSYSWSTSQTGTPVISTDQTYTATETGTYYVSNTTSSTCISIEETINVIPYGNTVTNPIIPFADLLPICPNDGKVLPYIFLCGANATRSINTGISDASSVIWEKLDENSCPALTIDDCANENSECTWNQIAMGPDYVANTSGQFRIVINYPGGCFSIFYFNVYQNLLNPTATSKDIICTTPGEITVGGVPSGYEYSIDGSNYQTSNVFSINTANYYIIYIRQIGVDTNPCIFETPSVYVRARDFMVSTFVTQPYCYGDKGTIKLAANDALPQYYFSISEGGILINSVGPIMESDYTFANLNPGTYTYTVSTDDGCTFSDDIIIIEPPLLTATVALTKPLSCTDGELTVYPVGGAPPYIYYVNSASISQDSPIIAASTPGVYDITVIDSNNCSATTSITVEGILPPEFTVTSTNILCADSTDGTITFNVTNANGNTLEYSIDGGTTFFNSQVFTGLSTGNYSAVVQYMIGADVCLSDPQPIIIAAPTPITGTATATPYTCSADGTINVSGASGGTGTLLYSLDGVIFQAGNTFTGLTDGTYTITIQDANSCTFVLAPITLDPLNPPTDLTFSNTPLSCPAMTSDVTLAGITGGTTPLEYQIIAPAASATAYQTSNVFAGLTPDTYTFQVRDAYNCVYSESFTIPPLPPLNLSTIVTKDLDCTTSPDGIISGTISGGTAPFTYAVSFNGGAYGSSITVTGASFNHTATTDGTYQFQITDANGCTAESGIQTINVISLPEITSVVQTQPILCNGDSNAAIEITINNTVGTPQFVINVNNDSTGTDYGTQTSGLPAGDYTITLTDANSCTDIETITIAEPTPIVVSSTALPITCGALGVSKGSVIVNSVTGGTAPYNYFVTGTNGYSASELNASGTISTTFDVVDFGLYQINVVDSNGCSNLVQDVLVASPPNDLDISINTTADCITGGEAVVDIGTTLVGTGPFFFDIYRGVVPPPPPGGTWVAEDSFGSQNATFTGLIPGVTYTFIVYDASTGCSYYETATAPVPTNSTLTGSALTSNNITCIGSADGNVSFTVNSIYGVSTDISYEIFDSLSLITTAVSGTGTVPASGTLSVSNLGPLSFGTYFVLITETTGPNTGCSVVTIPFNITESAIDLDISATVDNNANCNPNSGVINAIATDGTPPYLYQLTTSATAPLATDPSWGAASTFNVNANSYYVHVIDAYGCIKSTPVLVLTSDPEPVITATLNNQCMVTEGNFEIDVTLTTIGIAPYSYSIDGGAFQTRTAPFSISNLSSGTHTVEIQDANGCGNLVSVDIETPIGLTPAVTALPTCNDNDGQITITGYGGTGSYTYAISPNPASITLSGNMFSGVPFGTYTVTITDASTLCSEDVTIVLPASIPPAFTTTSTAVTCFGDNNGAFEINVSGYSGPYTYEVFDSSSVSVLGIVSANTSTNPETVTGLLAGTYSVVIIETASPFCSATSNVIISSPLDALTLVATETSNVTCDDDKGTITAIANGGWGTYEYELTGTSTVAYSPNGTFTNLSTGPYTVNVRDAGGCIVSENVILDLPTPIDGTITASTNLLSCFGDTDATITISAVTGGQGTNYSYTLNMVSPTVSSSGPQTSPTFDGLGIGTYNVVIADGYNCTFTTANVTITEPTQIQASLVKETSQTCLTNTTLTLSATGGTGSYEYSDTASFTTVLGTLTSSVTFPVSDGTYQYYVRDANGCVANISNEITIDPLPTLLVDLDAMNATINCTGDNTGVIIATAQGGLGNYVYTLQDTSGNDILPVTQNSPGVFTELPSGTYQVQVDSGDCLTTSAQIPITEPATPLIANFIATNVTCPGTNNGRLEITASGGTGIIKYAISPQLNQFFESPIFENLTPGNYQAIAQDELGCFIIFDFIIEDPIPVMLNIVANSLVPEVCDGDLDGAFSIEISGGDLPYSVSLDDINGTYTTGTLTQTQFDFTGLGGGDHIVFVSDNLGCLTEWNITFPESVIINPEVEVEFGCTNNLSTNTVTVTVDASITNLADLDYSLNGGSYQVNNVFVDVPPGIGHFIDVRHTNGCIQRTELFDISQFDVLELALDDGEEINQIVAATSGGAAPYVYTLNGEDYGDENTFLIYESGDYTVTVTDSNGCFASATRYFEFIDVCIPNYFTPRSEEWGPGCTSQYKELTVDIFDRYGRKIATLRVGDKWDGKYKGIELPTGDYWYVVQLNDPKNDRDFVGHFTLYR